MRPTMPEMCEIVNSLPQWLHDETVMTGQSKERRGVTIKTRLRVSERRFRAGDESRRSAASLHFGETRTGCVSLISSSSPQDWNCHAWSRKGKKSQGINWVTKGLPKDDSSATSHHYQQGTTQSDHFAVYYVYFRV